VFRAFCLDKAQQMAFYVICSNMTGSGEFVKRAKDVGCDNEILDPLLRLESELSVPVLPGQGRLAL